MQHLPTQFEDQAIRRVYDEQTEIWNKLKERLGKEGSQLVTNCHQLKLPPIM